MKIKTSALTSPALDWAVAVAEGLRPVYTRDWVSPSAPDDPRRVCVAPQGFLQPFEPSRGGVPILGIVERERINARTGIRSRQGVSEGWVAFVWFKNLPAFPMEGPTMAIAAMRCYVASKLGNEVEIPDILVEG